MTNCQSLLAIVIGHKADLGKLVAEKPWHQLSDILPVLAQHPRLQPTMVQRHVVVEHLGAGEPVSEPLVVPALNAITLNLHRPTLLEARSLVGVLKVYPPLISLVKAVRVVVPCDADVEPEGLSLLVLLLGVPVNALAEQADVGLLNTRLGNGRWVIPLSQIYQQEINQFEIHQLEIYQQL